MKTTLIIFLCIWGSLELVNAQIPKQSNRPDSVVQDHMIYEPNKGQQDTLKPAHQQRNHTTDSVYTNPKHGTRKQDSSYRKQPKRK